MATPTTLTIWRNNRLDSQEELSIAELVDRYLASEWAGAEMLLERSVALFLTYAEHATWEDREAFNALCDLIVARQDERA